jgi:hypothetical protein
MKNSSKTVAPKRGYSFPLPPEALPTHRVASTAHQPLFTRTEAAAYLGISPQSLAADVSTQRLGVPMVKIGRRSLYRLADLENFCAANLQGAAANKDDE